MKKKKIIFPYGICNFYDIITENNLYIDRTDKIPLLEDTGKTILLLRPRRFGKSLLISMLENYYDVAKTDQFEHLFGKLAIGQNPTPNHNQYFVLPIDFSMINPQGNANEIKQSIYNHLNSQIEIFSRKYRQYLEYPIDIDKTDAFASLQSLFGAVQFSPHKLYLLIDEYDNFANEIMVSRELGEQRYKQLLEGEGIFKTMFKVFKGALAGRGLNRVFMTGVSPVVMSDLTSGQFVTHNIYFKPEFNDLCGFREEEVLEMLQQVSLACGMNDAQTAEAMTLMQTYYDGYSFVLPPDTGAKIYNPILVFHFLEHLQRHCRYPEEMLDDNLNIDRRKLEYAALLPGGDRVILKAAAEDPKNRLALSKITDRFGIEKMLTPAHDDNFVASLLCYLGMLTLGGRETAANLPETETPPARGKLILRIPNLTVRGLYFESLQKILLPELSHYKAAEAAETFYATGNLRPLCDYIEKRLSILGNRDYIEANELMIKAVFLSLLFNDSDYMTDSELELERGYADLTMIIRPDKRPNIWRDHLIEFKYIKPKLSDSL